MIKRILDELFKRDFNAVHCIGLGVSVSVGIDYGFAASLIPLVASILVSAAWDSKSLKAQ